MHYYGTYAIARATGFKPEDARIIAYSAQFVDDSTMTDSTMHEDGSLLYGVATAHHSIQAVVRYGIEGGKNVLKNLFYLKDYGKRNHLKQRRMWIPFHFYPGNEGDSFSKKLICRKNSLIVNDMFDNHIKHVKELPYILHLIGIASHVYMDTFSHYGFSGLSSRNNRVDEDSFKFHNLDEKAYMKQFSKFKKKYKKEYFTENWRNKSTLVSFFSFLGSVLYHIPLVHKYIHKLISYGAEFSTGALGHGPVATFPDQSHLKWSFEYEISKERSERNNPLTFLEGCEELHKKLLKLSKLYYKDEQIAYSDFSKIKETIKNILTYKTCEDKIKKWQEEIKSGKLFDTNQKEFLDYDDGTEWEEQKTKEFCKIPHSSKAKDLNIYKFHQAADYHRHYTLKHLLPKHGIIVN